MKSTQDNKSFEQMAKDAQSRKRMQELAGITTVGQQRRPAREILQDMIDEVGRIGSIVSDELKKRKDSGNE